MTTLIQRAIQGLTLLALVGGMPLTGQAQQMPSGTDQTASGADPSNPTPGSTNAPPTGTSSNEGGRPAVHDGDGPRPRGRRPARRNSKGTQEANSGETITVEVTVQHGAEDRSIGGTGVILRASRPRGPFEPGPPEPRQEWTSVADDQGMATFDDVPASLSRSGLELYAVATYNGIPFESSRISASDGANLTIDVFEQARDASNVRIERIRTIIEPWEDYLVFNQFWSLTVGGNRAVDTTSLGGKRFEKGLPLELPLNAEGIKASGRGETKIIDSTVNWKGVLKPGRTVSFRVRFSMPASTPSLVYEQSVDYPVDRLDVVLPLETDYEKVGRLDEASLSAPGFERVETTRNIPGLRRNVPSLYATGESLEAGESFAFQLQGLPFDRRIWPWIVIALGLLGGGGIFVLARRERDPLASEEGRSDAIETLEEDRDRLLDQLARLEDAYDTGEIDEVDYETESLRLREQLSLISDKLDELRDDD